MAYPSPKNKLGETARNPLPGIPLCKIQIEKLLRYYHGNISRTADKLGCTRQALNLRINKDPHLTQVKIDCRERFIDDLEECSWHKALQGDTVMQLFLLKTIGRHRGYDQDDVRTAAQDIAKAAFEFVTNRTKNPAVSFTHTPQAIEHTLDTLSSD